MGEVMSDEQKWIDDFEQYKKIKNPLNTIEIKNSPQ
jgi:hypothetical protein